MTHLRLFRFIAIILLGNVALLGFPCFAFNLDLDFEENEEKIATLSRLTKMSLEDLMGIRFTTLASGFKQTTSKSPSISSVITARDIQMMGARSVEEIFETVPGLHVSLSEIQFRPMYDVRGIHSANNYEILMMLDGIPVKSLVNGSRGTWTPPPVEFIQRIEIIRGPGSALYGADAVSGVINIITKTADDIKGTEIGGRVGSFQSHHAWLLHGSHWNGFDTSFSLDYSETAGHQQTVYQDMQSLLDKATGTDVSQAPGRTYLRKHQLNFHGAINQEHWKVAAHWTHVPQQGAGFGNTLVINPEENHKNSQYQIDAFYQEPELTESWEGVAQLSLRTVKDDWFYHYVARPGAIRDNEFLPYGAPNNIGFYQRQARLDLSGQYHGVQNHTLRLGMGYFHSDLYDVPWSYYLNKKEPVMVDVNALGMVLIPEKIRQNSYAFIQDSWKIASDWELTTGIRYDWYSDFDATINPRFALVWQTMPRLTTKLLYGSALRAPSFAEMYTPQNLVYVGNPDLKAEKSATWELAFDYQAAPVYNIALNIFHYKIQDRILRRLVNQATSSIYTYDNIGALKGKGFEVEGRWRVNPKSGISFHYAYAQAKTKEGAEAGEYPHQQFYLRHDWLINDNWLLDSRLNWVADRDRPVGDLRDPLKDYTELDLTLRYKNASRKTPWEFAIGGRNLLDQDRREPGDPRLIGDYPKAGREFFGEVRYKF